MNILKISVIVPTYNRAHFITSCLDAILQQNYPHFEVIVVDDGSDDTTPQVLEKYIPRILVLRTPNRGVSAARNLGITHATGEYIAFCDSDDLWCQNKLKTQGEFFQTNTDAMVCYTDEIWIRNGVRVNPCKHHRKVSGWIFEPSLALCLVSPSSVMMHRRFFDLVGMFDETLPACEDYDLWLRAALKMPFYFIDQALIIKQGGHIGQLSRKFEIMDQFRIQAILKCLQEFELTDAQKKAAIQVLAQKCWIIATGARKRGNIALAQEYEQIRATWMSRIS